MTGFAVIETKRVSEKLGRPQAQQFHETPGDWAMKHLEIVTHVFGMKPGLTIVTCNATVFSFDCFATFKLDWTRSQV